MFKIIYVKRSKVYIKVKNPTKHTLNLIGIKKNSFNKYICGHTLIMQNLKRF